MRVQGLGETAAESAINAPMIGTAPGVATTRPIDSPFTVM